MKTLLFTIQGYIEQFLFGRRCAGCGAPGFAICPKCFASIPLALSTEHSFIYGLFSYGNPLVSHAIWNLKYRHQGQEAKMLAKKGQELVIDIIAEHLQSDSPQKIIIVPIPQYRTKTLSRGFNQSVLIANWLTDLIPESKVEQLLEKFQETLPQSHISTKEGRFKNIHETMRTKSEIDPKQIYIIVDDVTTTGATFLEATRALRSAGAKNILCIALAHGYKRR